MTVFGGKRFSGDGGLQGGMHGAGPFPLMLFFCALRFFCPGIFSANVIINVIDIKKDVKFAVSPEKYGKDICFFLLNEYCNMRTYEQ